MPNIIEFKNISKQYSSVIANKEISFNIKNNSIHAILGENGAGKSTLVKILYGHVRPDNGEIFINSQKVKITKPSDAKKHGINMVFQHFSLFESLTVSENLILGIDSNLSMEELNSKTNNLSSRYGFNLNLSSPISSLSVGERQSVEIVRSLLNDPKILILDEPTSVLTPEEIKNLFEIINKLVRDDLTVIFISHKLDEIINLSEEVTILRNGQVVGTFITKDENPESLGLKMLGYKIPQLKRYQLNENINNVLQLINVNTKNSDPFSVNLKNINLNLKKGEIFGIAGVAGNGQNEFMEILINENNLDIYGEILYKNQIINSLSTYHRKRLSISFVTEQRLGHSAVPELSLEENILLSMSHNINFNKNNIIDFKYLESFTNKVIKDFNVNAPSTSTKAGQLSGGNLQKFIIGREILSNPDLLILSQPTWGIDVGSESFIRKAILELSQKGVSIIIISHDIDEILELCHQVSVLYEGSLSKPMKVEGIDITKLGKLMGGLFD